MAPSPEVVLQALAESGEYGELSSSAEIASLFGEEVCEQTTREDLERLKELEFVVSTESGYRLTITGREFLELDLDGAFVVVDSESR